MDSPARRALTGDQADLLRQIPSVDELLAQPRLAALAQRVDRELLVEITRTVLADLRGRITGEGTAAVMALDSSVLEERIASMVERVLASSLEPVINATGVILHTNLGRAPLIIAAAEEVRRSATSYSNLEYDLEEGARGKRDVHVGQLLERLTGAEAAIVVNNCAAAVLLVLAALAKGGEVIVSRGELIEIGDGFRIPEIMAQGGAVLREVGTTDRTHIVDYENAINENTRLLLRVHPSNFTITGFTEKPSMEELVALGLPRRSFECGDYGADGPAKCGGRCFDRDVQRRQTAGRSAGWDYRGEKGVGQPRAATPALPCSSSGQTDDRGTGGHAGGVSARGGGRDSRCADDSHERSGDRAARGEFSSRADSGVAVG